MNWVIAYVPDQPADSGIPSGGSSLDACRVFFNTALPTLRYDLLHIQKNDVRTIHQ
jgi:hypothetical protein